MQFTQHSSYSSLLTPSLDSTDVLLSCILTKISREFFWKFYVSLGYGTSPQINPLTHQPQTKTNVIKNGSNQALTPAVLISATQLTTCKIWIRNFLYVRCAQSTISKHTALAKNYSFSILPLQPQCSAFQKNQAHAVDKADYQNIKTMCTDNIFTRYRHQKQLLHASKNYGPFIVIRRAIATSDEIVIVYSTDDFKNVARGMIFS